MKAEKAKLMYVGKEEVLERIREYVKDDWGEETVLTPVFANENGQAGLVLYIPIELMPTFCTSLGIYAGTRFDDMRVTRIPDEERDINLYDILPVYLGVVNSDGRDNES